MNASSAMLAALQKKRKGATVEGDHQVSTHGSEHAEDADKDLHGLVASLNDTQKTKLKSILDTHDKSQVIAKGGSSTEEDGKVKDAMAEENSETDLQEKQENGDGGYDSDDIAKSMLDRKHLSGAEPAGKPMNLGERVKQGIAAKLKGKGKL